jgi:carboxyl-terminal processing protease
MNRPKFYIYLPIVFSLVLIVGIYIGTTFQLDKKLGTISVDAGNKYNKIEEILRYVEQEYVDTINQDDLVEKTIISMLENLDPHSSYISASELQANNEPLKGNFEGIGIEFNIVDDTICVVAAIPGGPSASVGVLAGDKIIKVEGETVAGVKITNKDVLAKLKGKSRTKVKISVLRNGKPKLLDFTITRGTIPIYSVDISYMLSPKTGYIKISRFAATTYDDYLAAFNKLKKEGMQHLVVDLRGNGGGYLNTAVDIADEFLSDGKEIVYTQGKARPRKGYKATRKGSFESGKLIILMDEGSASASEILAGAVQDNDRGTIVGRRSFGKGLVQEQTEFSDGSAMRLTIARYYTPTGRCIQKPYDEGVEAYFEEEFRRFESGELENADSMKIADSLKFVTPGGKIVYGCGGVAPDVFVPLDTSGRTHFFSEVMYNGIVNDFAFNYADKERKKLNAYKTPQHFNASFGISEELFNEFINYSKKNKVVYNASQAKISKELLKNQIKALIARNIWGNEGYYPVIQSKDNTIKKAIELTKQ